MKKIIFSLLILLLGSLLVTGCDGFTPLLPPNNEYDEENTTLDYIQVLPAQVEMKVNQSIKFEVKAFNSDHKPIAMDPSNVEKWSAMYSCLGCGIVWNIFPTMGCLQTTFTPQRTGAYEVWVKYDRVWKKADVDVY